MAYLADWVNLLRALDRHLVRESLDSTSGTLDILVIEEHLLQLGVGLADVTEFIVPLIDGGVGQPLGILASFILLRFAADDSLVVERDGVAPMRVRICCDES